MPTKELASLSTSDLNVFLFANIGVETNGSRLTMLSMLARLGKDPWAQAASWSQAPRSTAIDGLAASIAKMPLDPEALRDAHSIASRLILLLPRDLLSTGRLAGTLQGRLPASDRARLVYIGLCIAFWLVLTLTVASRLGGTTTR